MSINLCLKFVLKSHLACAERLVNIYIYIYIYKMIALMVKKKPASDLKRKIFNESLSRGKIYIGKKYILEKRKSQPCHANWKKSKDSQLVGQKKKNTVRAAKLQCKKCSILSRAK